MGLLAAGAAVTTAVSVTLLTGCGSPESGPGTAGPDAPITSTTKIAGAGVLGNQRRPDDSCAADPAPANEAPRMVDSGAGRGDIELRGDPQRIVALSGGQLDALCALGLQSRIVGAAAPIPSYLGTVVHNAPGVGDRDAPDLDAIRAAGPDLILGSAALTPDTFGALSGLAPTVFTPASGAAWQDTLRTVAAAVGRPEAADRIVDGFDQDAHKTGAQNDAPISRRRWCS